MKIQQLAQILLKRDKAQRYKSYLLFNLEIKNLNPLITSLILQKIVPF